MQGLGKTVVGTTLALLAGLVATPVHAVDLGDPIYQKDLKGAFRAEVVLEDFNRDVKLDSRHWYGSDSHGMDLGLYMARVTFPVNNDAAFYLDAGLVNDDDADSTPLTLGLGGRIKIYDQRPIKLSVVGNAHWVPSYDLDLPGKPSNSFYELGAGLLVSGEFATDRRFTLVPYGGLALSVLKGHIDGDGYNTSYHEKSIAVGTLGVSGIINKTFTVRLEGRFIGDSSLSASFGMAF